jgi:RimJ/RimL family protein N-acetyltransferase
VECLSLSFGKNLIFVGGSIEWRNVNELSDDLANCRGVGDVRCRTIPEVVTRRLLVRPTRDEDVDALNKLLQDSRVSCRFLNPPRADEADCRSRLVQDDFVWKNERRVQLTAIFRNEHQRFSEVIGAARIEDDQISYYIAPARWSEGFGFELVEAVCDVAWQYLALEKLFACILRDNVASRRIVERLGFVFCGLAYGTHAVRPGRYAVLNFELSRPRLK